MSFYNPKLNSLVVELNKHQLIVGLDPEIGKIPSELKRSIILRNYNASGKEDNEGKFSGMTVEEFMECHVDVKTELLEMFCAGIIAKSPVKVFKLNLAFFLAQGAAGVVALVNIIKLIHEVGGYAILDAKFGDIGNTAKEYAKFAYEVCRADGVTLNPYLGGDALEPFLVYEDKLNIILCHTTNSGATDVQEIVCQNGQTVFELVAEMVANKWSAKQNVALVLGATFPKVIKKIRKIVGSKILILAPGIGTQAGDLEKSLEYGGKNLFFNVSRQIIFASNELNFAEAAQKVAQAYIDKIRVLVEYLKVKQAKQDFASAYFKNKGVILDGHFLLTSGRHGDKYFSKDKLSISPDSMDDVGVLLANEFVNDDIEVVVGPAVGSNILASYIAGALNGVNGKVVQNCWTEKGEDQKFKLRPQFIELVQGKRILIAEDVLTTGGSANSTIDLVKENGGIIIGVGVLCNRGGITAEVLGVPEAKLVALLEIEFETWTKEECPLCKDKIPMNEMVGHAKKLKE